MTNEEAIKFLQQLYPNGGHCWLDDQRIEAVGMAIKALQEEPANDSFEAEVKKLWEEINTGHSYSIVDSYNQFYGLCMDIAEWQKQKDSIPVSEDLEEASKEWLRPQLDKSYANYGEGKMMELTHFDGYAMLDAIEFGAKWQKEQLMAKAVDGEVGYWNLRGLSINTDLPRSVSEGDKVKIIVIKED